MCDVRFLEGQTWEGNDQLCSLLTDMSPSALHLYNVGGDDFLLGAEGREGSRMGERAVVSDWPWGVRTKLGLSDRIQNPHRAPFCSGPAQSSLQSLTHGWPPWLSHTLSLSSASSTEGPGQSLLDPELTLSLTHQAV